MDSQEEKKPHDASPTQEYPNPQGPNPHFAGATAPYSPLLPPPYTPSNQGPITIQPGGVAMNTQQGILTYPPGMGCLAMIDQLLIRQRMEDAYRANIFILMDSSGQKVFTAKEQYDLQCCPSRLAFIKILDNTNDEVIILTRLIGNCCYCMGLTTQNLEVSSAPGTVIGFVEQLSDYSNPSFAIKNAAGDQLLKIQGPLQSMFIISRDEDVTYNILALDGKVVGKIIKQSEDFFQPNTFTRGDNFRILFPMELDVNVKATLVAAFFLIDAIYYNIRKNTSHRRQSDY